MDTDKQTETSPECSSNALSAVYAEIAELDKALAALRRDHQRALADISARGGTVIVTLAGSRKRKQRVNPSVGIVRELGTTVRALEKRKTELAEQIAQQIAASQAAEKKAKQNDKFAFLNS